MNLLYLPNYNLHWTLLGGQSFGWDFNPSTKEYRGFTQHSAIRIKPGPKPDTIFWQTYPEKDNEDFIKRYLRVDFPYERMLGTISKDQHVKAAIQQYPNLRVLQQDFEETLLSFVLSANNNIKAIRKSIRLMNEILGTTVDADGTKVRLFPSTEIIANTSLDTLRETKIGFRAKYLKSVAQALLKNNIDSKIHILSENDARIALTSLHGVGDKIADCVLIYSLGFDNVTPLDVWGKRILERFYNQNPKTKYGELRNWVDEYFEGFAGWAGQFLFEYVRGLNLQS